MDERDIANAEELQTSIIERGIAQCRFKEAKPSGFDGTCGCGEEIPEKRIALGYYRCVTCQSQREKRGGR